MRLRQSLGAVLAIAFLAAAGLAWAQTGKSAAPPAMPVSPAARLDSPVPQGMGRLVFDYKVYSLGGNMMFLDVWVDGRLVAQITSGNYATLLAESGEHSVELCYMAKPSIMPNDTLWGKSWTDIASAYDAFCSEKNRKYRELFTPARLRVPVAAGGSAYVEFAYKSSVAGGVGSLVAVNPAPKVDLKKMKQVNANLAAVYLDGSVTSAGGAVPSLAQRADALERRDASGYDPEGYDRDGFDRLGWTNPRQLVAVVMEVAEGSPASGAGIATGAVIRSVDGHRFSSHRNISYWVHQKKPGDAVTLSLSRDGASFADSRIVLRPSATQPAAAVIGIRYSDQPKFCPSENRSGETWSGSVAGGRQGWGLWSRTDGGRFIGSFRDDRAEGRGVELPASGGPEVQDWKAGVLVASRAPAGAIVSSRARWVYLGEGSRDALAEGSGDALGEDGRTRIEGGFFARGVFVSGTLVTPDGTRFSGLFADEALLTGTIVSPDGSRYEGQLVRGLPDGNGKVTLADTTSYVGEFKAGVYDGQGTITKAGGEKYEGSFKAGKPHGLGIYVSGGTAERCEYYEGQRIDQAYQIRVENAKQLEAMRAERERIAKEKADQAEQQRIASERAADAQKAQSEKSSNNLLRGLLGAGVAMAVGGSMGLDAGKTMALAASAGVDMARGDTSMNLTKSTGQALMGQGAVGSGGGGSASARPSFPKKGNVLDREPELSGGKWQKYAGDGQLYPFFQQAMVYYDAYERAIAQGYSEAECNKTWDVHRQSAEYAITVWKGFTKK